MRCREGVVDHFCLECGAAVGLVDQSCVHQLLAAGSCGFLGSQNRLGRAAAAATEAAAAAEAAAAEAAAAEAAAVRIFFKKKGSQCHQLFRNETNIINNKKDRVLVRSGVALAVAHGCCRAHSHTR